ncbi:hypothetical protein [Hahella ganghwensis]|uniref:hypothetical protein n=1 Tax=Hahella ganghwensis TaxID=286420 RepID=UPI000477D2A0|nr:hypothetical protein [Hahella ganghwensis]
MELMILSHLPTRVLEEGILPAAIDMNVGVTILTDCVQEHVLRRESASVYGICKMLDCDVFNPLSVAQLISVHNLPVSGVIATTPSLQTSAAILAEYYGLPGPSWQNSLLCSNKLALRRKLNPADELVKAKIIHREKTQYSEFPTSFPLLLESLESGSGTEKKIVRNTDQLASYLKTLHQAYAMIDEVPNGEQYILEVMGTPDELILLGGVKTNHINTSDQYERYPTWIKNPPGSQEILAILSTLNPGLGRHHVEYVVTDDEAQILEIHNGLNNDEISLSLNLHLQGDLFREIIKLSLGVPISPLELTETANEEVTA